MSPAPATPAPRYDVKAFLRNAGVRPHGPLAAPEERKDSDVAVEMIEEGVSQITAAPAPVSAFLDGIQNQMIVTYRGHRPVVLAYCAAGAAGPGAELVDVQENLSIVCAASDAEWVTEVNDAGNPIPLSLVPDGTPPEVERAVMGRVQWMRSEAERELTGRLVPPVGTPGAPEGLIVLDGSLLGRTPDPRIVSVVKTSRTRYLDDESTLYGLPAGWRSAVFRLDPVGQTPARYSTYVRLHGATHGSWSFGLVRLEAFTPDLLEPLAARAFAERQGPHSGDGRWDRHLVSVATCEKLLRARRPAVFDLFAGR